MPGDRGESWTSPFVPLMAARWVWWLRRPRDTGDTEQGDTGPGHGQQVLGHRDATDRGSGVCCSYLLILTGISTIYYYIHYLPRYLFVFRTSAPLIAHFLLQMQSSIVSGVKWVTDVIYCHHSTVAVAQKVSQYFSNWYKKKQIYQKFILGLHI